MHISHPTVLIYESCFVPHSLPVQLFLHAHGIAFKIISDQEMPDFEFLPEHRLFIFPSGGRFDSGPHSGFGGSKGIANFKQAISNGMNYLGICAGAYAAMEYSGYPTDIYFGLVNAKHRWPENIGPGVQFISIRPCAELIKAANLESDVFPVWYHNGPMFIRKRNANYRVLVSFEPTREERKSAQGEFLSGKHLNGAPAIIGSNYGKGRVVACSPHPELGDMGIRDYQKLLRQWLEENELFDGDRDPLAIGSPGYDLFMQTLGGECMQPVLTSRNWRLLHYIVDKLLQEVRT